MEINIRRLSQYLVVDPDHSPPIRFLKDEARRDQLNHDLILAGQYVEQFAQAFHPEQLSSHSEGIPVYGNWCGPGHGGGQPIDTLDSLCKEHDLCYKENGYFNCSCDQQLIDGIQQHEHQMKTKERIVALALITYFRMAPCIP